MYQTTVSYFDNSLFKFFYTCHNIQLFGNLLYVSPDMNTGTIMGIHDIRLTKRIAT